MLEFEGVGGGFIRPNFQSLLQPLANQRIIRHNFSENDVFSPQNVYSDTSSLQICHFSATETKYGVMISAAKFVTFPCWV